MNRHSLRLRLLLISMASIGAALVLAGWVLVDLFERHVERRVIADLSITAQQLAGHIGFDAKGQASLSSTPADPRFARPLSGLYWQILAPGSRQPLRSRSLWDYVLPLPADALAIGRVHQHRLPGPGGSSLLALERLIVYDTAAGERRARIAVAIDTRSIRQDAAAFAADLQWPLIVLAVFLIAVAAVQIGFGLRPLEAVRRGVNAIRREPGARLQGAFPGEVMPLVTEVNELLDAQDKSIEQARHQAADLAHALKTPLTVILSDAQKLKHDGQDEIGTELTDLVRQMRRTLDREFSRARAATAAVRRGGARTDLVATVRSVSAALRKTPSGAGLSWELAGPAEYSIAMDPGDVSDLVGNILENAAKWARARVRMNLRQEGREVIFKVSDDGPGAPRELLDDLLQRGTRLDESKPGTGIGLAIVNDIAAAYGGRVSLDSPEAGGFCISVFLPEGEPIDGA